MELKMTLSKLTILSMVAILAGCASSNSHHLPREKALVEPKQVISAIALEKEINARGHRVMPKGVSWFKVIQGTAPIVITAPHATRPLREGKRRFSDGAGTAALAVELAKMTGATVIYTTYEGPSDPNYYDDNRFKEELARVLSLKRPKLVIDLHGSHPFRSYDIDLGTMNGESLQGERQWITRLVQYLNGEGINSISYNRFPAAKNQTITKFVSKKGIPAIQLEVNATYVTPAAGNIEAQRFSKLLQALARFINGVK